jgi:hypothetical protein
MRDRAVYGSLLFSVVEAAGIGGLIGRSKQAPDFEGRSETPFDSIKPEEVQHQVCLLGNLWASLPTPELIIFMHGRARDRAF